jgi:AsmA protein
MTALDDTRQAAPSDHLDREPMPWRPLLIGAAAILLAAVALIGPRLVSRTTLASMIETRLCGGFGVECSLAGPIHVRLLPYPMIEAKGLTLTIPQAKATVRAARVEAELRALPLLLGRISVNHLDLAGAEIDIAAPPGGMRLFASADGAGAALVDALVGADKLGNRLTRISLDSSRILIRGESPRHNVALEAISGVVAWPQGEELFARVSGFMAGQALRLRIEGPSLPDLTRSGGAPMTVNAILGEDEFSYRGRLVKAPDLVAAGTLEAILPSVKRLLTLSRGVSWPSFLPDQALHIGGQAFVTSRGIDFENAEFAVGRSRFSGGMSLRMTADGRPSLSGTIAAQLVDLDSLPPMPFGQIRLPSLGRVPDLDLRMSARRVVIGGVRFDGVAAGLILADHRLDLSMSQGSPAEGSGKLRIIAMPDPQGLAVKLQASSDTIDIGSALAHLSSRPFLSGSGGFNMVLEGRGGDLEALTRSLSGKASLQMKKGALSIPDEGEPVMSIGEDQTRRDVPEGAPRTTLSRRFSEANFVGVAEHGILSLSEGWIGEGATQIAIGGKLDLGERSLDVSLNGSGETAAEAPWRLRMTGPWSAPTVASGK